MNKIKIAFVGAGYMTTEHAKAFAAFPEVEIVGFSSRTKERGQKLSDEYNAPFFVSISEMYEISKADLVVVSVPELSTSKVLKECFNFPWSILCEKPVGFDLKDARNIHQEMKNKGRQLFVALNRRHYGSVRFLVDYLSDHANGKRYIHLHDQEDQFSALKAGQPEIVVKNWMYANSIHMIDFLNILGRGEITNVEKVIPYNAAKPEHVLAKISYSSGDIAVYEAVWNRPGPWFTVVTTDDARWEMRPIEQLTCQAYGSRKVEPIPGNEWDTKFKPGLYLQAAEMLKAIKGEKHLLPTMDDAMKTMEIISRIYS